MRHRRVIWLCAVGLALILGASLLAMAPGTSSGGRFRDWLDSRAHQEMRAGRYDRADRYTAVRRFLDRHFPAR